MQQSPIPAEPYNGEIDRAEALGRLRAEVAAVEARQQRSDALPFGLAAIDDRLGGGGLEGAGLHEIAAASPGLNDDAAATLFAAGIAARFAGAPDATALWALTRFDLYAPGLEQAGLGPERVVYAQGRDDAAVLALAEDALRDRAFSAVVAEVKRIGQAATRRLQLAAADSETPLLLLRRWARRDRPPLDEPSLAVTRWRIGSAPSVPLGIPGVGRACWSVDLVRQRGGNPFSLLVEACDATGLLALPSAASHRAAVAGGALVRAA